LYLVWIKKDAEWGDGVRVKRLHREIDKSNNVFERIGEGNTWWLMLRPKKNDAASIEATISNTLEDMPAEQKQKILDFEESERLRVIAEKKAEEERIKQEEDDRLAKIEEEKR
jgi:hypothetical protein